MKCAIVQRTRKKEELRQIQTYIEQSAVLVEKFFYNNEFKTAVKHLRQGDYVILADVMTLGRRYEEIIQNLRILAAKEITVYLIKEQILINTSLPQSVASLADICLKLYKGVLSFKNKSIQDNLLKANKSRGAPNYRQQQLAEIHDKITEYLNAGKNLTQIAKLLNCSRTTLYRYVKQNVEVKNA